MLKITLERLFPTLGSKIAVAVVAVLLLSGGTFVFMAHRTGYTMLEQQAELRARSVAEMMKGMIEYAMLHDDTGHLNGVLRLATQSPYVLDAYLLQPDGKVSVNVHTGNAPETLPLSTFHPIVGMNGEKYLSLQEGDSIIEYIVTPIARKQSCGRCHHDASGTMGYFGMKLDMGDLRSPALEHRTTNIAMTLLTFGGLGGIIYIALAVLVIKPIGKLHSHIRKIEGGVKKLESGEATNFPLLSSPIHSNDEIADLCRDFNSLITRLNETNAKLIEMHQRQLEQADRLATTGQMAAGIAHEIKNPIAGVLGAVQVFDSEVAADDPRKEIFAEMMVQLERVNHAINDLLTYARPTLPVFEDVSTRDIIQRTLTLLKRQLGGKEVDVRLQFADDDADVISADRKQLQQVLWNILLNAIQSIDTRGTITIGLQSLGHCLQITVCDTGCGISPEHIADVFKPFFTMKHKGTGLGMTICKRIVEQHHGLLAIASTPGVGTTITITLPRKQEAE